MNQIVKAAFGALALLLIASVCTIAYTLSVPKWEYNVRSVPDPAFVDTMNALGSAGWEMVSARRASDGGTRPVFSYEVILRRRKSPLNPNTPDVERVIASALAAEFRRGEPQRRGETKVTLDVSGKRYHNISCLYVSISQGTTTRAKAEAQGYKAHGCIEN